jgi:hypothetical protein
MDYFCLARTNLIEVPAGNHLNMLRVPGHHPMLSYFILDRTKFAADTAVTVEYRLDEFSGASTAVTGVDPPYVIQSTSYNTLWYPIQKVCRRVQFTVFKAALNENLEIQNLGFVFQSEAGA